MQGEEGEALLSQQLTLPTHVLASWCLGLDSLWLGWMVLCLGLGRHSEPLGTQQGKHLSEVECQAGNTGGGILTSVAVGWLAPAAWRWL